MTKTGEVYFRESDGSLWLATSYVNSKGVVSTQSIMVEPAPEQNAGAKDAADQV